MKKSYVLPHFSVGFIINNRFGHDEGTAVGQNESVYARALHSAENAVAKSLVLSLQLT